MSLTPLDSSDVIAVHQQIVGDSKIRDQTLIESAVGRAFYAYYDTVWDQAAALLSSLATNHPFVDGNKRTAWITCYCYLRLNAPIRLTCDKNKAETLVLAVAESKLSIQQIGDTLKQLFL